MGKLSRAEAARALGLPEREVLAVERFGDGTLVTGLAGVRNVVTDAGEVCSVGVDVPGMRRIDVDEAAVDPVKASVAAETDSDEPPEGAPEPDSEPDGEPERAPARKAPARKRASSGR